MKVLIANANKDLFVEFNPKVKFYASTANTSFFSITSERFDKLKLFVKEKSFNPYSLMSW